MAKRKIKTYGTLNKKEIKKEKIRKAIFITISVLFFLGGAVAGLVGLYLEGWDWVEFFKSPGLLLGAVIAILVGVTILTATLKSKGNSGYGGQE